MDQLHHHHQPSPVAAVSSPAPEEEEEARCCCMCGDVGFPEHLLSCLVCRSRVQHSYCSSMYPNIDVRKWRCEWCLHDQGRRQLQVTVAMTTATKKKQKGVGKRVMERHRRGRGGDKEVGRQREIHDKPTSSVIVLPASCDPGRRWKHSCNLLSPRRRYKLLADVLLC